MQYVQSAVELVGDFLRLFFPAPPPLGALNKFRKELHNLFLILAVIFFTANC